MWCRVWGPGPEVTNRLGRTCCLSPALSLKCIWGSHMKTTTILATAAVLLAAPAFAAGKNNQHHHHGQFDPHVHEKTTITVSCFRGPWKDVIWDRPNAVFVDSLVNAGYKFETAHAIAERVCRDEALVNNPEAMKSTMRRIFDDAASHRNKNH